MVVNTSARIKTPLFILLKPLRRGYMEGPYKQLLAEALRLAVLFPLSHQPLYATNQIYAGTRLLYSQLLSVCSPYRYTHLLLEHFLMHVFPYAPKPPIPCPQPPSKRWTPQVCFPYEAPAHPTSEGSSFWDKSDLYTPTWHLPSLDIQT